MTSPLNQAAPYQAENHIRIVTSGSLFDGHDAAINIMRRLLQATGAEIIHLGHNRSAREVVEAAVQEDAQAIALTSYQGGHLEYFPLHQAATQRIRCRGREGSGRRRRNDSAHRD